MPTPKQWAGIRGGEKHKLMEEDRAFILDYYDHFGWEATRRRFHFNKDTLSSFLRSNPVNRYHPTTHADRAEIKSDTALKVIQDLERRIGQMERQIGLMGTEMAIVREDRREETAAVKQVQIGHADFISDVSARLGMRAEVVVKEGLGRVLANVRQLPAPPKLNIADLLPQEAEPPIDEEVKRTYLEAHPFAGEK